MTSPPATRHVFLVDVGGLACAGVICDATGAVLEVGDALALVIAPGVQLNAAIKAERAGRQVVRWEKLATWDANDDEHYAQAAE